MTPPIPKEILDNGSSSTRRAKRDFNWSLILYHYHSKTATGFAPLRSSHAFGPAGIRNYSKSNSKGPKLFLPL